MNEILKGGEIEESVIPWVMKNSDIRFCMDYRILNVVTRKDVFPIPRIDDLLDQQHGKTVLQPLMPK